MLQLRRYVALLQVFVHKLMTVTCTGRREKTLRTVDAVEKSSQRAV